MRKSVVIGILILLVISTVLWRSRLFSKTAPAPTSSNAPATPTPAPTLVTTVPWPIADGKDRVTKKFFGTYVTPQNSPVQPERFTGYHTGWDFETTPAELNADVPIVAACDGSLIYRNYVNGYGGVAIESCLFGGQTITVLYGHLRLASIVARSTNLKIGDRVGLLGSAYSTETDGERKHLHFGIHKGSAIELKGYVQNKADLSAWIDPTDFFK